jgi:plastocyanin
MSRRRGLLALVALAAVAAGVMALGGVGTARSSRPKVVKLYDNYYSPVSVKIRKRGKVKWKWTPVFNTHNVKLTEAPRGVKKSDFRSQTSSSPTYTFTKRFTKPGKYHFICTIHPVEMQMDVRVRKPG